MVLKEFPDLKWLKEQIKQNFDEQQSWENKPLPDKGWPTVLLNTQTTQVERTNVKGPFSVFINLSGTSTVKHNNREIQLNDSCYTITNSGETYNLLIDNKDATETFNLHFGDSFSQLAVTALLTEESKLIDDPSYKMNIPNLPFRSFFKQAETTSILRKLKKAYESEVEDAVKEEMLLKSFNHFWNHHSEERKRETSLKASKKSTQIELMQRLYRSIDYIHAHYSRKLELEMLANISALSKFHFLRLFKQAFYCSPYQYIKSLRLQKALEFIQTKKMTLLEIAPRVGFENASSLSRAFLNQYGDYPSLFKGNKN